MRKKVLFIVSILLYLICILMSSKARAQNIGINSNGAAPNSAAMLDIDVSALTTKKGLLIPRMTSAQKTAMSPLPAAAPGLIIYQTDGVQGFYYNSSATTTPSWNYIPPASAASGWLLTGNSGTSPLTNFIGTTDAQDLVLKTNNAEVMRVTKNTKVGINESNPTATLQVRTYADAVFNVPYDGIKIQSPAGSPIYQSGTMLGIDDGTVTGTIGQNAQLWNFESGFLRFGTRDTERMRIDQFGSIGINETNPASTITMRPFINGPTGAAFDGLRIVHPSYASSTVTGVILGVDPNGNDATLTSYQNGNLTFGTSGSERMRITPVGNVAIGATNPSSTSLATLVLQDNIGIQPGMMVLNNGYPPGTQGFLFGLGASGGGSTDGKIWNYMFGDIEMGTNGTELMRLSRTGRVGIKTNIPSYDLDVNGSGNFSSSLKVTGYTLPVGDGGAGQVISTNGGGTLSWVNPPSGTVSYVDLSMPSIFSVGGGPITSGGTFTVGLSNQSPNTVFAGPPSGASGQPFFRSLVAADLPSGATGYIQNNAVNNVFATGQAASFDITGSGEMNGNLKVNGNIGIGKVTPSYKLDVFHSSATGQDRAVNILFNSSGPGAGMYSDSTAALYVRANGTSSSDLYGGYYTTTTTTTANSAGVYTRVTGASTGAKVGLAAVVDGNGNKTGTGGNVSGNGQEHYGANFVVSGGNNNYGYFANVADGGASSYGVFVTGTPDYAAYFEKGAVYAKENVSIGYNSPIINPSFILDVNGKVNITNSVSFNGIPGTSGYLLKSNGANAAPSWIDPNTFLSLWTEDGSGNIYNSNTGTGFVGVNTTTPATMLDVRTNSPKSTSANTVLLQLGTNESIAPMAMKFAMQSSGSTAARYGSIEVEDGGAYRNLSLQPTNGNVGIGTTSPGAKLDVAGKVKAQQLQITTGATSNYVLTSDASGNATWQALPSATAAWNLTGNAGTSPGTNFIGTTDAQDFIVKTNNAENVRVTSAGNVGIGTNSPGTKLEVAGKVKAQQLQITTGATNNYVLTSDASGNGTWQALPSTPAGWGLTGNAGTTAGTNFIGTTDNVDVVVKRGGDEGVRYTAGGAMLATGNSTTGVTPTSGAGRRMMWIPAKSAFRAGEIAGTEWDDANIGNKSIAMGPDTKASGYASVAIGEHNWATGGNASAFGWSSVASGTLSFALGLGTTASSTNTLVVGAYSQATGTGSIAVGNNALSNADTSLAIGSNVTASGARSLALGSNVSTAGFKGALIVGDYSTVAVASSTAINQYKARFAGGYIFHTDATQTASNTIVFNSGNVGVGTLSPANKLDVFGSIRTGGPGLDGQLQIYSEQGASDFTYSILPHSAATQSVTLTLPPNDGNTNDVLVTDGNGNLSFSAPGSSSGWALTGNTGMNDPAAPATYGTSTIAAGENFIGTTDAQDLVLATNLTERFRIQKTTGNIGIGTAAPTERFHVTQNTDVSKNVIYSTASQVTTSADLQNTGVAGFGQGANSSWGYGFGVKGVSNPSSSFGGAGIYAGLSTSVPTLTLGNNYYALYADAGSVASNKYAATFLNGNVGIGTSSPTSALEVNGALAMKVKTAQVAGTNNPDNTGEIWLYTSGTGSIVLPAASACTNRMYVILNNTGAARTISSYRDLTLVSQTSVANSTSLWLVSDGTNWQQIK